MSGQSLLSLCLKHCQQDGAVALVTVQSTQGSSPREEGTQMLVTKTGDIVGTIGGGALEFEVIADACAALSINQRKSLVKDWPLGPDLGQCCGGRVITETEFFYADDLFELESRLASSAATPCHHVLVFGAGHVGRALIMALAPLPFTVTWIDDRASAFPPLVPHNVIAKTSNNWLSEIERAPDDAMILVMTYSHALDLEIIDAVLRTNRFSYIGLIGSLTKRARFETRLRAAGHTQADLVRLHCPIGVPNIAGKEPAVIAASVAADLLIRRRDLRKQSGRAFVLDDQLLGSF